MEVPDKSGLKNAPKAETKGEEDVSAERFQVVDRFNVEKIILESSNSYPELLQTENESSRRLLLKCESESTAQTLFKGQGKVSDHASFPEYISADSTSSSKTRNLEKRIKPANLTKNSPIDNVRNSSTSFKSTVESKVFGEEILETVQKKDETYANEDYGVVKLTDENKEKEKEHHKDASKKLEGNDRIAKNRLEKSQLNIGVLQQNLSTKINASTVENYQKELLESRTSLKLPVTINSNANEKFVGEQVFDEEFFQKHNLNEKLKIQENLPLEADLDYISNAEQVDEQFDETSLIKGNTKPRYSKKVSEVEKRWSGEFLENHLERQSSGSSKSSYVEEFGSGSSTDSVGEHQDPKLLSSFEQGKRKTELENNERSTKLLENRASEETLANSTGNTVDSDSCLEDRIKALEEYIETGKEEVDYRSNYEYRKFKVEQPSKFTFESAELCRGTTERLMHNYLSRTSSDAMPGCCRGVNARGKSIACKGRTGQTADGYANLIREFTMDAGTSRTKKEEKQKKKLGLRRLLPGFFSPKDSRKDYKKKESKEKKRPVDKHFARYQQNGNYTRSPDTMNLNDDIKRNVKLDNSLNGSIIEERLDEIKRELFSDQGPITSTPDHLLREDDHRSLLRHRAGPPRLYTADSSLSSIAPDERWNERNAHLGISPDIKKFEQRQKREEFGQRYSQLERKHSLQESNHASRSYFFQRNHGPSGRISAPPTERYLVRPRAIHPIDRPLPAIPRSRLELSNYANYLEEQEEWQDRTNGRYENNGYTVAKKSSEYANQIDLYGNITNAHGLILKSVSAQVKITRQPIVNQNQRAPLVGRSPKCLSSGSSQKSGDCEDSSCTPNSSQKSEFSPSSSKSGEYYLHSSRNSGSLNERDMDESGSRQEGIYENEKTPSRSSTRCMDERIYYETPPSPYDESCSPSNCEQRERSIENHQRQKNVPTSDRDRIEKSNDTQKHIDESSNGWTESISRGPSTPTGSPHKTVSPVGNRSLTPSRKAQPNEQIMIASPKREIPFETWVSRPPNAIRRYTAESPVNMTNVNYKHDTVNTMSLPNQDSKGKQEGIFDQGTMTHLSVEIPKSENIYDQECQGMDPEKSDERMENTQRSDCEDRIAWVAAQVSSSRLNTNRTSESENVPPAQDGSRSVDALIATQDRFPRRNQQSAVPLIPKEDQRYLQWQQQDSTSVAPQLLSEPIYIQRSSEPIHGQHTQVSSGLLSPSKQETRQHLEAFYWQQRALEAHRKSLASPVANTNLRQMGRKIDLPEVREAMYWQQLKKLNEEQQRRIYEQNLMEESTCSTGKVKNLPRTSTSKQESANLTSLATDLPVSSGQSSTLSLWNGNVHGPGANTTGKPPLMQNQKCQNQPVLIVRPQQAIRERREVMVPSKPTGEIIRQDAQRSRSASPHFHRGAPTLRKIEGNIFYEVESRDADGKAPPPIFKRGSLTVGESVDYGTAVGCAKRVSFSNHSTTSGRDFASGKWPTKHGIAAEPPTRKHCSEDCISDTDSMFLHQERLGPSSRCPYSEYDANKPLPPLPTDAVTANTTKPGDIKTNAHRRWNGKIDAEPSVSSQRILKQKEEEWNSDGKGRQSNDIGGSGRGEGEAGSNEVATGRRGGGGGIGSGGGSVLGVGGGGGNVSVGGVGSGGRSGTGSGGRSRDEPRRHTVGGNHQSSLHHQQFNAAQQLHPLHPHHLPPPPHSQYGTPPVRHTTMDLEMGTKSRQRKSPLPRGYPPPSSAMLFDDDPGIMSEVETSSTGFRRGGKQRSSLPVVRTPSKTLERPLGLVFLQYRNETKRALLPNEITSIDTVKALFVRSFPKQLTMEYLDSPQVKVYIHDSNKDMFYELEDLRSHLRDIRDRSVLRLFESADGVTGMPGPLGIPGGGTGLPPHWEDQSYFSEPEFDSEYQHQHIHKSKTAKNSTSGSSGYYIGGSSTLPRGGPLMRAYSPATSSVVGGPNATPTLSKPLTTPGGGGVPPAKPLRSYQFGKSPLGNLGGSARFSRDSSVSLYSIADRLHGESGYMSSPERGGGVGSATGRFPPGPYSAGSSYEDPYYSQYSGTVTPVIDEEASDTELLEESYSLYGVKPPGRPPSGPPRSPFPPGAPPPSGGQSYDATRIRVEHMERQLANLTGLVQKALTHAPHTSPSPRDYLQVPAGRDPYARVPGAGDEFDKHSSSSSASLPDDSYLRTDVKPPKLGKDKSVSFEKSVSFSDEPPDMNSPKQHSPQHAADTKPTKPAIKSSTLPRMSSQERDRHKPTPPPKPAALVASQYVYRDLALTPEMYNQLRGLQRKAKDLRQEVRNLRRMSQAQAHTVRETILDTFVTIRAMLLSSGDAAWDAEKIRLSREEDLYRQEMLRLKKDLTELENTVEELRGNVINKKTRVNMSDVENMALVMSKSSKTVADLKVRFPSLQEGMKGLLSSEMEMVVRAEKFLKEEPEQLELALKRCKKLTSTLVTLKRLASVQEQRLPNTVASMEAEETPPITPTSAQHSKTAAPMPAERTVVGTTGIVGGGSQSHEPPVTTHQQRPENALDALLDELQTFSRPSSQLGHSQGSTVLSSDVNRSGNRGAVVGAPTCGITGRAPYISDIGRKGSVDSSSGPLLPVTGVGSTAVIATETNTGGTLRRLHSYPSSSDTDTSPPIARLQVSLPEQPTLPTLPQGFVPGQKPPVPERNAELLQLASVRRVPPPPPPRTSSRSPLASPTSPQLPPRNHACNLQSANSTTLRRPPPTRGVFPIKESGKPPMALPQETVTPLHEAGLCQIQRNNSTSSQSSTLLSTSNSSSCESVNSQEGLQNKKGRQEQLEQRHQELLRKQKALQEQYARLQQLQRNTAGLTTVPPAPPDLLKKTGSESNLLAKMGLGLSAASSGSLTSLAVEKTPPVSQESSVTVSRPQQEEASEQLQSTTVNVNAASTNSTNTDTNTTITITESNNVPATVVIASTAASVSTASTTTTTSTSTTSKIYETDIL